MAQLSPQWIIALGLVIPGLLTGVGALPIFLTREVKQGPLDVMLGGAAGVMLAATCFSLILPAIESGGGDLSAVLVASAGIFIGAAFLDFIDKHSPHEHLLDKRTEGGSSASLKKIWLFVIAIAIHNFPEGMATGVGFGTEDLGGAMTLALGIGLQNMPEGLAVALALARENYTPSKAFTIALLTGLLEPIGAVLGYGLVHAFSPILPFVLAFAGGAMLFVISDEIIPETHQNGYERQATYGIVIGFIVMMVLDVLLG